MRKKPRLTRQVLETLEAVLRHEEAGLGSSDIEETYPEGEFADRLYKAIAWVESKL